MSVSFYVYVASARGQDEVVYDWPEAVKGKMSREVIPAHGTPEYAKWYDGELETLNPDYDPRLDINMGNRNAAFVLNELGFPSEDYQSGVMTVDAFEAGVKATLARNPEPIPGLVGYSQDNVHSSGVPDGYANMRMAQMLGLVSAAREYGATHIGWG